MWQEYQNDKLEKLAEVINRYHTKKYIYKCAKERLTLTRSQEMQIKVIVNI